MFSLTELDFTVPLFWELSSSLARNYKTLTLNDYFSSEHLPKKFAIIRHDVDRLPSNALETAKIEAKLGIKATYYFRATKGVFIPKIIKEISNLGHEIGYHYEVLSDTKGDSSKAIKLFEYNLSKFRKVCDITTISMHGGPLSKLDNCVLWVIHDFHKFGIIGEADFSIDKELDYFSDTGRNWGTKNNLRNFIPEKTRNVSVDTTSEFIDLIESRKLDNLYILSHPERWSNSIISWSLYFGLDLSVNLVKRGLIVVRK